MKAVFAPHILAGVVLLALATGVAQNGTPATVRWVEGAPNALTDMKNNNKVEGLKGQTVHVYASLADLQETQYNRVWVEVTNHGKSPLEFDPMSVVLLHGDKPEAADAPDKAANSIQKVGEARSQQLSSSHCNLMTYGNPSTGGGGGAGCAPTDVERQMARQVADFSGKQAEWVCTNAIKEKKKLAPEDEVQGVIVFKKDKKPGDYILRVSAGGETFEFPFHAENKAPAY
jgi:hypothetical protein